jgi:hypothetical protein
MVPHSTHWNAHLTLSEGFFQLIWKGFTSFGGICIISIAPFAFYGLVLYILLQLACQLFTVTPVEGYTVAGELWSWAGELSAVTGHELGTGGI